VLLTPQIYKRLQGAYNRRNAYGAVLAAGPVLATDFFGRGELETQAEMDYVGDVLREVAPLAEKAGVTLGLEDTISARDNVRIMERTRSPAVRTYYDVGNSSKGGFNVVEEICWLRHRLPRGGRCPGRHRLQPVGPAGDVEPERFNRAGPGQEPGLHPGAHRPPSGRLVRRSKLESATVVA
jgi:hypothetical protein